MQAQRRTMIGSTIRDTYEVEEFLGSGVFSEVYRVKHRFLGRRLAMKALRPERIAESDFQASFHEPRLLLELEHPNIVRVFDAGVTEPELGSRGYYVIEYMPGGSLKDYLWSQQAITAEQAVALARQICAGMAAAHGMSPAVVHRDLKPDNILVGYPHGELRLKIADFGMAKIVNRFSLAASAQGNLLYRPPESIHGYHSPAGDVFALGMILYEMLTGRLPFRTDVGDTEVPENARKLIVDARLALPDAPSRINSEVDAALDAIVMKAVAHHKEDRYPTAVELLADLEAYARSAPAPAPATVSATVPPTAPVSTPPVASVPVPSERELPARHAEALALAAQALELGRQGSTLRDAIDRMERAMTLDAALQERYSWILTQWQRGILL